MTALRTRFVLVLLRGGLDGLAAVAPYGDPRLTALRPGLAMPEPGRDGGLLDLGGFWGLHPALPHLHAMYCAGEMLAVHAVGGPHRSRSHFEAMAALETGAARATTGWLNRAAAALGDGGPLPAALALGNVPPLVSMGETRFAAWCEQSRRPADDRFYVRVAALHAGDEAVAGAVAERRFIAHALPPRERVRGFGFVHQARIAGQLLALPDGPRIAVLDLDGFDTHADQAGRIVPALRTLDNGMDALRTALGAAWRETAVLIVTEFGRTVAVNGTGGTDHGTAGAAFVLGGCVAGGMVRTNWPGLASANLEDGRDLAPTADVRSIAKALLGDHLDLPRAAISAVFPDDAPAAMRGLLRPRTDERVAP